MSVFKPKKDSSDVPARRRNSTTASSSSSLSSSQLFQRNRTLTGSRSGQFRSVGEQQADIMSPRAAAHELAAKKRHLSRLFMGVIGVVLLLIILLWQLIIGVAVHGKGVVLTDAMPYEKSIQEYLARQPLDRLRFSLDEAALTTYVAAQHPEVESINLAQPSGLASSRLELTMRRPIAQWSVGGENQYVDSNGVAFKVNYYDTPNIQVVDNSGISPTSGVAVASSRFLSFVGRVVSLSQLLQHEAVGITIPASSTRQIEVTYKDIPYPIKFSIDRPAGEQVEDMTLAAQYLSTENVPPEYLDVRVSGRVFYK